MRLFVGAHVLAAGALVIASVLTVRFVVLPWWLGILVGLLLYALTIVLTKADDGDKEVALSYSVSSNEPQTAVDQTPIPEPASLILFGSGLATFGPVLRRGYARMKLAVLSRGRVSEIHVSKREEEDASPLPTECNAATISSGDAGLVN